MAPKKAALKEAEAELAVAMEVSVYALSLSLSLSGFHSLRDLALRRFPHIAQELRKARGLKAVPSLRRKVVK